jgi:tetratricopeptide (TPR) repeat protein
MASAVGTPEEAAALFEQAAELYRQSGDTHAAARSASWLALSEQRKGQIDQALERMESTYAEIADDEPDSAVALVLMRLGTLHWSMGNVERAAEVIEQGLDPGRGPAAAEMLVRGWTAKASMFAPRRPEEARGLFQLAVDTALAHDLPRARPTHTGTSLTLRSTTTAMRSHSPCSNRCSRSPGVTATR